MRATQQNEAAKRRRPLTLPSPQGEGIPLAPWCCRETRRVFERPYSRRAKCNEAAIKSPKPGSPLTLPSPQGEGFPSALCCCRMTPLVFESLCCGRGECNEGTVKSRTEEINTLSLRRGQG